MNHKQLAQTIIDTLDANGVKAYIYCEATTSSVYVRFEDQRNSSIRIADHTGKSKYRYKWNVRTDKGFKKKHGVGWKLHDKIWRYWCIPTEMENMIAEILKRAELVKSWPVTYTYGEFKKKSSEAPKQEIENKSAETW